eukprot:scaffold58950_cov63-Phaeocystis_antarctica.AAC.7
MHAGTEKPSRRLGRVSILAHKRVLSTHVAPSLPSRSLSTEAQDAQDAGERHGQHRACRAKGARDVTAWPRGKPNTPGRSGSGSRRGAIDARRGEGRGRRGEGRVRREGRGRRGEGWRGRAPTVPHTMYQTPRENRMITGFIENSWPKSHGSRMLPTAMWTRKGTSSAMTHLYGARLSRKMMGTTSSVEMDESGERDEEGEREGHCRQDDVDEDGHRKGDERLEDDVPRDGIVDLLSQRALRCGRLQQDEGEEHDDERQVGAEGNRGGEEGARGDREDARRQHLQLAQLDVEDDLEPHQQLLPQQQRIGAILGHLCLEGCDRHHHGRQNADDHTKRQDERENHAHPPRQQRLHPADQLSRVIHQPLGRWHLAAQQRLLLLITPLLFPPLRLLSLPEVRDAAACGDRLGERAHEVGQKECHD